jgi:toxin ParE1/3/4
VAKIRLSAAARSDLARIDDYSAEHFGDDVAADYLRGFGDVFEQLQRFPLAGQARPDYREGTRCKLHRSHRILYRVTDDVVFIQRILHHSQNVPAHLRP